MRSRGSWGKSVYGYRTRLLKTRLAGRDFQHCLYSAESVSGLLPQWPEKIKEQVIIIVIVMNDEAKYGCP